MDWLGRWESGWDGSPPFGFPSPPLVPAIPPFGFPSPPFHRPSPPTRLVGGLPAVLLASSSLQALNTWTKLIPGKPPKQLAALANKFKVLPDWMV